MWTFDLVQLWWCIVVRTGLGTEISIITRSPLDQQHLSAPRKTPSTFSNHSVTSRQRYATLGYSNYPIDHSDYEFKNHSINIPSFN